RHILKMNDIGSLIDQACAKQDLAKLRQAYLAQDEFVVVENFLPPEALTMWDQQLEPLKPLIHRNYIPKHKKGGSVSYGQVAEKAPAMTAIYHQPKFIEFLQKLVNEKIKECPASDPHRCALYSYTEERLLCHLHTRNKGHEVEKLELQVKPGTLVIFNGDKVWHSVTPIKANEQRFIISMQYVTNGDMNPIMRFVSNMKDAIAYFGFKGVFSGKNAGSGSPARN
ncbi:MAG: putative 2-oxoglutarate-Fe(II) oxygenase superfamily, partial [Verrucomicrobia bacterium]|nr:putative 2-oxoglutarate-Fe(II) oxygenase superfamily [Verrucomicrobiota bacterium]